MSDLHGGVQLFQTHQTEYRTLVDSAFVRLVLEEGLTVIVGAGWITRASLSDAPGDILMRASYSHAAATEVLLRLSDGLAHLVLSDRSLVVRIAAPTTDAAERIRERLSDALPELDGEDLEVPARFWWWQPQVAQNMARMIAVPGWHEVQDNYVGDGARALGAMMDWPQPPGGGRLVLWHGAPGTGKTTALRALAGSWRDWAEFQFVTDPEQFLTTDLLIEHGIVWTQVVPALEAGSDMPGGSRFHFGAIRSAAALTDRADGAAISDHPPQRLAAYVHRVARLQAIKCVPRTARAKPLPPMWHNCPDLLLARELDVLRPRAILTLGVDPRWALAQIAGFAAGTRSGPHLWRGVLRREGWGAQVYGVHHPSAPGGKGDLSERALIDAVRRLAGRDRG